MTYELAMFKKERVYGGVNFLIVDSLLDVSPCEVFMEGFCLTPLFITVYVLCELLQVCSVDPD